VRRRLGQRHARTDPGGVERLRLRRVHRGGRLRRRARAARLLPRVRVPRHAHRPARPDPVPAPPRRRPVVHRGPADPGHRRGEREADSADGDHAALRRVRRLVARDELHALRTAATGERHHGARPTMTRTLAANIRRLTLTIAIAFLMTSIGVGYWSLVAASDLTADLFTPRLGGAVRDRPRGKIVDASGRVLAESVQDGDAYRRKYSDRSLAQVVGYASF